jgi:hypothetical protein
MTFQHGLLPRNEENELDEEIAREAVTHLVARGAGAAV